jgi:hypothetical protein
MHFNLLYRGPLKSCNYACGYCPFAKKKESNAEHLVDAQALSRFVAWVLNFNTDYAGQHTLSILFTPWGEALTHKRYQQASITLSHLPAVAWVSIQSNLSAKMAWVKAANREKIGFWATFHPDQRPLSQFIERCQSLDDLGVAYSVGVVAKREHYPVALQLKAALLPSVYVWANAYKDEAHYYQETEIAAWQRLDPHFKTNLKNHDSLGLPCNAGESAFSIDGEGNVTRCHFVKTLLGNIYQDNLLDLIKPRTCPNKICDCFIGYMHLPHLALKQAFGAKLLSRIRLEA